MFSASTPYANSHQKVVAVIDQRPLAPQPLYTRYDELGFRFDNPFILPLNSTQYAQAGPDRKDHNESPLGGQGRCGRPAGAGHRKTQSASVPTRPTMGGGFGEERIPKMVHLAAAGLPLTKLQLSPSHQHQASAVGQRYPIRQAPSAAPLHPTQPAFRPTPLQQPQQQPSSRPPLNRANARDPLTRATPPRTISPLTLSFSEMHQMMCPPQMSVSPIDCPQPQRPTPLPIPTPGPLPTSTSTKPRPSSGHFASAAAPFPPPAQSNIRPKPNRRLSAHFDTNPEQAPAPIVAPSPSQCTASDGVPPFSRPRARSCLRASVSTTFPPSSASVPSAFPLPNLPPSLAATADDVHQELLLARRRSSPPQPGSLRTPSQLLHRLNVLLGFGYDFLGEYIDVASILEPGRGYAIQQELPEKKGLKSNVAKVVGVKKSTKERAFGLSLDQAPPTSFCQTMIGRVPHKVPSVAYRIVEEIYKRGLNVSGLFRLTGDTSRCMELFSCFSLGPSFGENVSLGDESIHNLSGVLKLYLREMPEALIHPSVWKALVAFCVDPNPKRVQMPMATRVATAQILLRLLPPRSFSLLVYLLAFLTEVPKFDNRLTSTSISIIFGPMICAPRGFGVPSIGPANQTLRIDPLVAHNQDGGTATTPPAAEDYSHLVSQSQDILLWLTQNWEHISAGLFEIDLDLGGAEDLKARLVIPTDVRSSSVPNLDPRPSTVPTPSVVSFSQPSLELRLPNKQRAHPNQHGTTFVLPPTISLPSSTFFVPKLPSTPYPQNSQDNYTLPPASIRRNIHNRVRSASTPSVPSEPFQQLAPITPLETSPPLPAKIELPLDPTDTSRKDSTGSMESTATLAEQPVLSKGGNGVLEIVLGKEIVCEPAAAKVTSLEVVVVEPMIKEEATAVIAENKSEVEQLRGRVKQLEEEMKALAEKVEALLASEKTKVDDLTRALGAALQSKDTAYSTPREELSPTSLTF